MSTGWTFSFCVYTGGKGEGREGGGGLNGRNANDANHGLGHWSAIKRDRTRARPNGDEPGAESPARGVLARSYPGFSNRGACLGPRLGRGFRRGFGLLPRLGLWPPRFARRFRGFLQTIDVSEAAAALLDFIVLFTHTVSPPL